MKHATLPLPTLTGRQQQIFNFIQERIRSWGFPPTIREIGEHFGIRSTNGVVDHVKALKRKGYLTQLDMKSRTLQPCWIQPEAEPASVANMVSIPLLGRVAAGEPMLAEQEATQHLSVDKALLGANTSSGVFALKVVGESMVEAGILHGDLIFVHKDRPATPGAIVVVIIDQEATVKRFIPEGQQRVRLQPANQAMQPMILNAADGRHLHIAGVVIGVWRRY